MKQPDFEFYHRRKFKIESDFSGNDSKIIPATISQQLVAIESDLKREIDSAISTAINRLWWIEKMAEAAMEDAEDDADEE